MRIVCLVLMTAVGVLHPLEALPQVRPQIAAFVTPGCRDFHGFTPDGLKVTSKDVVARAKGDAASGRESLEACLSQLHGAVLKLADTAAPVGRQVRDNATLTTPRPTPRGRPGLSPRTRTEEESVQTAKQQGADAADTAVKEASTTADTQEELVHLQLVRTYLAFRNLQRWKEAIDGSAEADVDFRRNVVAAFNALADLLHEVLAKHGLTQPFAANLVTAFSLNAVGSNSSGKIGSASTTPAPGSSSTPAADVPQGADPAGFVMWESIHFYAAPDRAFDINLAGNFGFQPVLALVQPAPNQTGSSPADIAATFQQAFVWSAAAQPNFRVADLAEVSVIAKLGQSILGSAATLIQNGDQGIVHVAARNGTGRAEIFMETGARIAIYGQSLEVLHLKRGLLTPMFSFAAGLRRDNRFSRSGVLESVDSPEQRVFFRVQVDGLQLANKDQSDKPFTIGMSVDFDGPLKRTGNYVPPGTRILIRGDLNLFKAAQSGK